MGAFEYTALNHAGRLKKGILEGDTARQVRQLLRERSLTPVSVDAVAQRETKRAGSGLFRRSISATDLALLTRQLATLVQSGTVLEEALATVVEQAEKPRLKSIVMAIRSKVLEGHTLAAAFGDFPAVFPELFQSTVAAGEQTGRLDVILERLADYTEFRQQLRQKVLLALLYPVILTGIAMLVVAALLTYVVPQVINVFHNLGQELPLLTRILIAVSGFMQAYGIWLLAAGFVAFFGARIVLRNQTIRFACDRFLLQLPVVGKFVRSLNTARFARTFSIMTISGVPALEGLQVAAQVISNTAMRKGVEEAALRVREGGSLYQTLGKCGYFPPITIHLIGSGEASSRLGEMLERAAVNQERDVETLIAAAMGIFEPLLVLAMGGVVLFIVLAILLPVFDLNQLVK